jgi:phospholipid transport system substrate-binding protein|tara:strand:+ start:6586 stop:7191 length:606 start_codon:yes stop_codon:yes gene_type:complete
MNLKKFFSVIFILLLNNNVANSVTYNSNPKIFIEELVQDAVKTLSDNSISVEEKNLAIEEIALENVDIQALGLYTLGNIRKEVDQNTLEMYQKLFQKYFLKSLTSRLTDYSSQKFEVVDSIQKSSNYTIVNSKIAESVKSPEIKIDWRVYTKNPDKPLIRDLIVEGLSLARTQKEEFASILKTNNNDINALIQKLEKFIEN